MKKIIYFLLILLSSGVVSCKKALEENPLGRVNVQNLNPDILNALLNGIYEPLTRSRGRLWESSLGQNIEAQGEYIVGPTIKFAQYNFVSAQDDTGAGFTTFYECIGRCNLLLQTLNSDNSLAQSLKDRAKAEALFVRSICYFWLVRLYGDVPMRLTPIVNSSDVSLAKTSKAAIYTQLINDVKIAEGILPATVPATLAGRATAGAAKVLLADIYLTTGDFPNARLKAKEVIDNKTTYGYDLVPSLATLYSPTLPTNSEDVFSLKFIELAGYGMFLAAYPADPRAQSAGLAARGLLLYGANNAPLIRDWDRNDNRFSFNLYNEITIAGVKYLAQLPTGYTYLLGKYKDPGAPTDNGAGNDYYLYRYADALLIFAEAENKVNGPTAAAYDAINQVRRRGYGVSLTSASTLADLPANASQSQFDDMIFRERGYEFMYEGKRWFDMQRTGRANQVIAAAGKTVPTLNYWLIPNVELSNNPLIK